MVNINVFGKTIKINLLKKVRAVLLKVHIKQFGVDYSFPKEVALTRFLYCVYLSSALSEVMQ